MARRRLPTGIQTFREVRDSDCYYVDKSSHIELLLSAGKHYFLSRPRRFGKSLLLDTVKELFEGSQDLFEGLAIAERWDWSVRHPVLRLDFSGGLYTDEGGLEADLADQLTALESSKGLSTSRTSLPARFRRLIEDLHGRTGERVVVLVDEYDKPIVDALAIPDLARSNRDFLRGLYANVKFADAHIRFTMLAGVTRFSKVSLFSGLNNLVDITLDPRFSDVCGYTDSDLDTVFEAELDGLDRSAVREWYNGYSWLGERRVYNPYDILLLFQNRRFGTYWFETGTPDFLVETLSQRRVPSVSLGAMIAGEDLLSAFDVDHIATEALLFQTGYLTIASRTELGGVPLYHLDYPNREVRQSLNSVLLKYFVQDSASQTANSMQLQRMLFDNDIQGMRGLFQSFFASIPYEWYMNNNIASFEGYYASVFYSYFAALGLDVTVEDSSSHGRLDMAVRCGGHIYLFEFKVAESTRSGAAMAQMLDRRYADKYRALGEPVHLVAVEFSRESRNITAFDARDA